MPNGRLNRQPDLRRGATWACASAGPIQQTVRTHRDPVLGFTTATTAFLGAIVVDKSGLDDWGTLALAAFIVAVGCCAAVLSPHRKWTFVEGAGAMFVPHCRLSWCSRRCAGGSRARSSVASTILRPGWALGVSSDSPRAPSACRARAERTEADDLRRQVSRLERALTSDSPVWSTTQVAA